MDKARIAERFSAAAPAYDRWAWAQRRMAEGLAGLLPTDAGLPAAAPILELGCGTGLLTGLLLDRFPERDLLAIDLAPGMIEHCRRRFVGHPRAAFSVDDAESFAPPGPLALVASNCTFQWLADIEAVLMRLRGGLTPGGCLALGVMLAGSLAELDASHHAAVGRPMPALPLWTESQYRQALARAGFGVLPVSRIEDLTILHESPSEAMHALREIGASLAGAAGQRPLTPGEMRRLAHHYREQFTDPRTGKARATYRAFFILARPG